MSCEVVCRTPFGTCCPFLLHSCLIITGLKVLGNQKLVSLWHTHHFVSSNINISLPKTGKENSMTRPHMRDFSLSSLSPPSLFPPPPHPPSPSLSLSPPPSTFPRSPPPHLPLTYTLTSFALTDL